MKKLLTVLACVITACFTLFAVGCAPSSLGDVCEKLLEKGYEIEAYYQEKSDEDYNVLGFELEEGAYLIEAYKETAFTDRVIYILYFKKSSDAKNMYDEYKTDLKEMVDDNGVVKKHGKMVIIATESAYEDFTD